jgi:hypothetical protein
VVSVSNPSTWWIVFPLAAAAVLRLYGLGSDSIWFDEAVSIRQGRLPFWDMRASQRRAPTLNVAGLVTCWVAAGLCACSRGRSWRALAMTGVPVATTLPTIGRTYTHPWNADWRKAVAFVEERAPQGGAVFFPVFWEVTSYRFHAQRKGLRLSVPEPTASTSRGDTP